MSSQKFTPNQVDDWFKDFRRKGDAAWAALEARVDELRHENQELRKLARYGCTLEKDGGVLCGLRLERDELLRKLADLTALVQQYGYKAQAWDYLQASAKRNTTEGADHG